MDNDGIETIAPSSEAQGKDKQAEPAQDEWKSIAGEKFKTPADVAKAYKELEKKLGESSEETRRSREFMQTVQPLLDVLRNDPKLFEEVDKRLRNTGQPGTPETNTPDADKTQDVRTATSDILIAQFEGKYGIDRLAPEEQRKMREKIGAKISELTGQTVTTIDLRRLPNVLDNAYILANKDSLIEKSKLEALASVRGADGAAISSLPSSQGKGEETLTPEEEKVANKLGLAREQYLKGKKRPANV